MLERAVSLFRAMPGSMLIQLFPVFVTEMTGPIQEMTRNSQQREPLPFAPISRHEKVKALSPHWTRTDLIWIWGRGQGVYTYPSR